MDQNSTRSISDEALQKIGRNLVNLQKLEGMLKMLVTLSNISGTNADLAERLEAHRDDTYRKTLGSVVGDLFETTYAEVEHLDSSASEDIFISLQFRVEGDENFVEWTRSAFSELVDQRNHLIHHRLLNFDVWSEESCRSLIADLDEQHSKIRPLYKQVQKEIAMVKQMGTKVLDQIKRELPDGDNFDA